MSWASKPSYPTSALSTVTLKATEGQAGRWARIAKQRKMARGAFIAYCADFYCNFLDAERRTREDYDRALHPENWRGFDRDDENG